MLQTLTRILFPPACVGCHDPVEQTASLCPACWADTPFIHAPFCHTCGGQLAGDMDDPADILFCDSCMAQLPPWTKGRAIFEYGGVARDLVLGLKHADRHDLIAPFSKWAVPLALDLAPKGAVLVPVPLHWRRMAARRFNQSELIARAVAKELNWDVVPDALIRRTATPSLDGKT
ncbi:MAG: double zinc ribbon domain-containing protein, partial [Pseudomonadota bacterium]